jgi:hypothetical protein
MLTELVEVQRDVCRRYDAVWCEAPPDLKVGISRNVRDGVRPLNGLRHPPQGETTGWYIWAGEEPSREPDFFVPLHVNHLMDWCPEVLPFLGLPPGYRFLLASDYEDVWKDDSLLDI